MALLLYLLIFCVVPAIGCGDLCKSRNRDQRKGQVVAGLAVLTGFGGYLVWFLLWLGLKRRDPVTRQLY